MKRSRRSTTRKPKATGPSQTDLQLLQVLMPLSPKQPGTRPKPFMQVLVDEIQKIKDQELQSLRNLMLKGEDFVIPLRVGPNVANARFDSEKSPLERGGLTMGSSRHQVALKIFEKLLARVSLTTANFEGSSTKNDDEKELFYYTPSEEFIPGLVRSAYSVLAEFEKHILLDTELYPPEKKPRKRAERKIDLSD